MQVSLEDAFNEAVSLQQASKFDAAENLYRQILQHHPAHLETSHNLGLILANRGSFDSALALLKFACESVPGSENFLVSYVETLVAAGHRRLATATVKKAVTKGVAKSTIKNLRKRINRSSKSAAPTNKPSAAEAEKLLEAYNANNNDQAIALANALTVRFPDHPLGWKVLGAALGKEERYEESVFAQRRAQNLSPEDPEAHNGLGVTYLKINQPSEAELSFRKALALRPKYADAHANLGNALKELERFEEAHSQYHAAIELQPSNPNWRINQGWAYFATDDFAQAQLSFLEAIQIRDDHPVAHSALGITQYAAGASDFGLAHIQKAADADPGNTDFLLLLLELQGRLSIGLSASEAKLRSQQRERFALRTYDRLPDRALIEKLRAAKAREMDKAHNSPVYGNGTCSRTYSFFEDEGIQELDAVRDLHAVMSEAVKSKIHVDESFFNIYGAGSGIPKHTHISRLDRIPHLNLGHQKYSLVFYVEVGDQRCADPGVLTFYDPSHEFLPTNGSIVVFPADRPHSASYGGRSERIIMGTNFYAISS